MIIELYKVMINWLQYA